MFHHANIDQMQFPSSARDLCFLSALATDQPSLDNPDKATRAKPSAGDEPQLPSPQATPEQQILTLILAVVGDFFAMSTRQIRGRRRALALRFPRAVLLWMCVQHTESSLSTIGQFCDQRSSSAVRHQCLLLQKLMLEQPGVRTIVEDISRELVSKIKDLEEKNN